MIDSATNVAQAMSQAFEVGAALGPSNFKNMHAISDQSSITMTTSHPALCPGPVVNNQACCILRNQPACWVINATLSASHIWSFVIVICCSQVQQKIFKVYKDDLATWADPEARSEVGR